MLVFKNKSKNGKTYVNFILDKRSIFECKNSSYVRYSVPEDYLCGLSDKEQVKINDLVIKTLKVEETK